MAPRMCCGGMPSQCGARSAAGRPRTACWTSRASPPLLSGSPAPSHLRGARTCGSAASGANVLPHPPVTLVQQCCRELQPAFGSLPPSRMGLGPVAMQPPCPIVAKPCLCCGLLLPPVQVALPELRNFHCCAALTPPEKGLRLQDSCLPCSSVLHWLQLMRDLSCRPVFSTLSRQGSASMPEAAPSAARSFPPRPMRELESASRSSPPILEMHRQVQALSSLCGACPGAARGPSGLPRGPQKL